MPTSPVRKAKARKFMKCGAFLALCGKIDRNAMKWGAFTRLSEVPAPSVAQLY
jgi:hypothetical protein